MNKDIELALQSIPPTSDAYLWEYIKYFLEFEIPRVKVCQNHCAPFDFIADVFFERVSNVLGFASRGSGKTRNISIIHLLNSIYKTGCDTATVGAIEHQAQKCYQYLLEYIQEGSIFSQNVRNTRMGDTVFKNNSRIEVLPATLRAINSPHPQKAFLDEVELVDWDIYQEFLNMVQSNEKIKAQNILISTRKFRYGTMQKILDSALTTGMKIYAYCIWEVAENCKEKDCKECERIVNGKLEDGLPRTFASVCQGKMRISDGFLKKEDIINRFLSLDRGTWEAQQECLRPEMAGLVHKWFDETRHIKDIPYDPALPLYEAIDWGGTNPYACLWIQETPDDRILEIDELYIAGIAPSVFAQMILERRQNKGYKVETTFGDPTGKDCILEFEKAGIKVIAKPADVGVSLQEVIRWGEDDRIYTDPKCKMTIAERRQYRWEEEREGRNLPEKPIKEFDHAMDAERIYFINRHLKRQEEILFSSQSLNYEDLETKNRLSRYV
ncbi:MAG: hypothetical protein ACOYWZ_04525 [Bacillota bacterium]